MWVIVMTVAILYIYHVSAIENLALGKPVWEDQPWEGGSKLYGAKNAVDGRYDDRSYQSGQCVRSEEKAETATLGVDLGGVVSISHIKIFYRTDYKLGFFSYISRMAGQMAGFFLYVSNTTSKTDGHLCFHEIQTVEGTPSEDQIINCSVQGRYVVYYNERLPNVTYPSYYSTYAHYELCELEVYGCSLTGYYGPNCSLPCPTNCQESRCDVSTGHCMGCLPGYQRPDCSKECPSGSFGLNCLDKCTMYCAGNGSCDHVTGICDEGCKEGWDTPFCDKGEDLSTFELALVLISVAVSVFIMFTGSVLMCICWKRKHVPFDEDRHARQIPGKGANEEKNDEYMELHAAGGYANLNDELRIYSN